MEARIIMQDWGPELAVLLGAVEGLTEFLPVSSTGHLIVVGHFVGFTGATAIAVEIAIQLGAILAIIAYERRKIGRLLHGAIRDQQALRTWLENRRHTCSSFQWKPLIRHSMQEHRQFWFLIGLAVAFLPAAFVGLLLHEWIEDYLFSPQTVAAALIGGGLVILAVESLNLRTAAHELEHVKVSTAFRIGLAQCAALIPGVSRSGATIIGGLLSGLDRKVATEYSFFLALPTMIAATFYKLFESRHLLTFDDITALGLGLLVSFLVAWGVIAAFLAFVKRHTLRVFAYYRLAFGAALLLIF